MLFAAAALGMFAACSKNEVQEVPQTPPVSEDGPVAVQFGLASPNATVSTKGVGAVGSTEEGQNVWNMQDLYIFGFDRSITDFTKPAFIDNVLAKAPKNATEGKLEVMNGKPDPNKEEEQTPEPFYYQGSTVYDFYGYHIDDAYKLNAEPAPAPVKAADKISLKFKINGTQDIMLAKADPKKDIEGTEVDNPDNAYSAYAARRNVQPTLTFKHQLARFTFEIVGKSQSATTVKVDSIQIKSKTKGELVIVGETPGIVADVEESEGTWLSLMQRPEPAVSDEGEAGALIQLKPIVPNFNAGPEATQTPQPIGESIMVLPGEKSYELLVGISAKETVPGTPDFNTPLEPMKFVLDAKNLKATGTGADAPAETFEAGKSYKVTINVIGPEEVVITAALEAWEDGGNITVDPDEPPVKPAPEEPLP